MFGQAEGGWPESLCGWLGVRLPLVSPTITESLIAEKEASTLKEGILIPLRSAPIFAPCSSSFAFFNDSLNLVRSCEGGARTDGQERAQERARQRWQRWCRRACM